MNGIRKSPSYVPQKILNFVQFSIFNSILNERESKNIFSYFEPQVACL